MRYTRTTAQIILLLVFALTIFTPPVIFFAQSDKSVSAAENRNLAPKPKIPKDKDSLLTYFSNIEKYYNDHFGLRDRLIAAHGRIRRWLTDLSGINLIDNVLAGRILKGRNGWIFLNKIEGNPLADYQNLNLYSREELWRATISFAARNHWLEKQNVRYLLFFAPDKHTIYSEYLPEYIGKNGDLSSMDQLYGSLARYTTVPFVDLRAPLISGKEQAALYWEQEKEDARLYWKTDSHWNSAGADIAQYAIARKIAQLLPGAVVPRMRPKEDFKYIPGRGDLTRYLDEKSIYDEKVPYIANGRCVDATHGEYRQRVQLTRCDQGKVNALVFHDSFFLALKPFIGDYFAKVLFSWEPLTQEGVRHKIAKHDPAIVIEEHAERFLPLVPEIRGEDYSSFWQENYAKWDEPVYRFSRDHISSLAGIEIRDTSPVAQEAGAISLRAVSGDPQVYLQDISFARHKLYMLKIDIVSPAETRLQIYYSKKGEEFLFPTEELSEISVLYKGENVVYIPLFSGDMGSRIRFDPGMQAGEYQLKSFEIRGAEDLASNGVWK